jgi:hypothetical protein
MSGKSTLQKGRVHCHNTQRYTGKKPVWFRKQQQKDRVGRLRGVWLRVQNSIVVHDSHCSEEGRHAHQQLAKSRHLAVSAVGSKVESRSFALMARFVAATTSSDH